MIALLSDNFFHSNTHVKDARERTRLGASQSFGRAESCLSSIPSRIIDSPVSRSVSSIVCDCSPSSCLANRQYERGRSCTPNATPSQHPQTLATVCAMLPPQSIPCLPHCASLNDPSHRPASTRMPMCWRIGLRLQYTCRKCFVVAAHILSAPDSQT